MTSTKKQRTGECMEQPILILMTDSEAIGKHLAESVKTIEQRVTDIQSARYVSQEMLRQEVSI